MLISFKDILGNYAHVPTIEHDTDKRITSVFIGDRWRKVGDIKFTLIRQTGDTSYMEMNFPDIELFVSQHEDEGAREWLEWGAGLN